MKKFLFALIVSLLVTATSHAEIQTFTGTDEYTVGETETQADAKERSRLRALRNAQEQAGVLIKSRSRMKDLELVDDEVVTIAAAVLKVVGAPDYKVRVLDDGKSTLIVTTVTVQIDTDDVDRRLKTIEARENPKPPVDKPKPIEKPAPQPVEEPKPEKVEPPTEKIEQPVEDLAPVEEPKPAEPITPPTEKIEQPAEHGIKTFQGRKIFPLSKERVCKLAKEDVKTAVYFYIKDYCAKKNYRPTKKQIENFTELLLKLKSNVEYHKIGDAWYVKVTAELNLDDLNTWLEKNFGR